MDFLASKLYLAWNTYNAKNVICANDVFWFEHPSYEQYMFIVYYSTVCWLFSDLNFFFRLFVWHSTGIALRFDRSQLSHHDFCLFELEIEIFNSQFRILLWKSKSPIKNNEWLKKRYFSFRKLAKIKKWRRSLMTKEANWFWIFVQRPTVKKVCFAGFSH